MQLTKSNIKRFEVIEGNSNDETRAVLELCGEWDGVLIKDNAGWSMTVDNSYEDVVSKLNGNDEIELNNQSVVVDGIAVQKDIQNGGYRILEGEEAQDAYYLV